MMKKTSKVLALLLSLGMLIGGLTACGGTTNNSSVSSSNNNVATGDVYTSFAPDKLVSNGVDIARYSIIVKENAIVSTTYAATELQSYIEAATGKTLPIKTDATEANECEIVLGNTNRTADIDISQLGVEGFTLKTVGNKLFIAADDSNSTDSRGVLYGVYTYLEKLGYRFYTTEVEYIPQSDEVFVAKTIDETQIPRLSYRDLTYNSAMHEANSEWSVKQKVNGYFTRALISKLGGACEFACGSGHASGLVHTSFHLVPAGLVEDHPEYFALNDKTGERMAGEWDGQVCYTNEGAFQYMKNSARGWLERNKSSEYMSISINDNWHMCQCDNCKASDEQYGVTGTVLRFTNRLAEELAQEGYKQKFVFLAYFATAPAPKGGVVPADNVVVQLAVDACQAHGLIEGKECSIGNTFGGDEGKKSLAEWGAISKGIMVYGYAACYNQRVQPVPNYVSFLNTLRYYAEKTKVEGHFSDCIGECPSGEFGELKSYIISKIQWNPLMTEAEMWYHVRDFLQAYYGESAAEYLFDYIKLTVEQVGDKCWENNLGNLRDKDIFFADGTLVVDKLDFMEEVNELWSEAMEWADDATYLARIERSYIQVLFYETKYIAQGHVARDPDMYDYYVEQVEKLQDYRLKYGVTS